MSSGVQPGKQRLSASAVGDKYPAGSTEQQLLHSKFAARQNVNKRTKFPPTQGSGANVMAHLLEATGLRTKAIATKHTFLPEGGESCRCDLDTRAIEPADDDIALHGTLVPFVESIAKTGQLLKGPSTDPGGEQMVFTFGPEIRNSAGASKASHYGVPMLLASGWLVSAVVEARVPRRVGPLVRGDQTTTHTADVRAIILNVVSPSTLRLNDKFLPLGWIPDRLDSAAAQAGTYIII